MSNFHSGIEKARILEIINNRDKRLHFVGALGAGMYPLMSLSRDMGHTVSGSDCRVKECIGDFDIKIGHAPENALGADLVIYTLAAEEENPELKFAKENAIPTVSRAEYLGALMENYNVRVGVAGTHGKSTSTAILDKIFSEAKLLPTTIIGARLPDTGTSVRKGGKEYLIYEACEYKDSFLKFSPTHTLFTNIELDHVDYFKDIEEVKKSFLSAMSKSEWAFVNADDENLVSLIPKAVCRTVTFGEREGVDFRAEIFERKNGYYNLIIRHGKDRRVKIELSIPGRYNATNMLGAAALALHIGIPSDTVKRACENFCGIERRMEFLGEYNGACLFYDYAHHPTEIRCAIQTVKKMTRGRIGVIFRPHTYSRTKQLFSEFSDSLSGADFVILAEIDSIREKEDLTVSSKLLAEKIGKCAVCIGENDITEILDKEHLSAIIIMGAADLDLIKEKILKKAIIESEVE